MVAVVGFALHDGMLGWWHAVVLGRGRHRSRKDEREYSDPVAASPRLAGHTLLLQRLFAVAGCLSEVREGQAAACRGNYGMCRL